MATVTDVFNQLRLPLWWKMTITQDFGENGEKGADYALGGTGKPVGSITSGKVVYVGDGGYAGSSIGQIVQVLTSDGALIHYQHLKTSNVHVGQAVQTGTLIGTGGGCPVGAYLDPSSTACARYDSFSTGEHIEVRYSPSYNPNGGVWTQNWQSPAAIFNNLAGKTANAPTNNPGGGSPSGGTVPVSLPLTSWGTKIGVFLIAALAVGFGLYILFQKQVNEAVGTGAKTAAKAVLI